jgi:uncharacterized protein
VIAVDTNILVYSHLPESPMNEPAFGAMQELVRSRDDWAIPWPCLHEFLAIVTNPRINTANAAVGTAISQIETWLEVPTLRLLAEGPTYWAVLRELLEEGNVTDGMVHDARIAALCLDHGVTELWTADRDFERFHALAPRNPLLETQN